MRSEHEILELILNTAKIDDRIRAVIMHGSRTNPNVPRDSSRILTSSTLSPRSSISQLTIPGYTVSVS